VRVEPQEGTRKEEVAGAQIYRRPGCVCVEKVVIEFVREGGKAQTWLQLRLCFRDVLYGEFGLFGLPVVMRLWGINLTPEAPIAAIILDTNESKFDNLY
jgi:hypothetical protein